MFKKLTLLSFQVYNVIFRKLLRSILFYRVHNMLLLYMHIIKKSVGSSC